MQSPPWQPLETSASGVWCSRRPFLLSRAQHELSCTRTHSTPPPPPSSISGRQHPPRARQRRRGAGGGDGGGSPPLQARVPESGGRECAGGSDCLSLCSESMSADGAVLGCSLAVRQVAARALRHTLRLTSAPRPTAAPLPTVRPAEPAAAA